MLVPTGEGVSTDPLKGGNMNKKRFLGAVIAVFAAIQITDPIIHGMILGKSYAALQHVWRPDMMSKMWIMLVNSFMFSILFVYIFHKGCEGKGLLEGVRFGLIVGFFVYIYSIINQYVVYPLPFSLICLWGLLGIIQFILYGVATAFILTPRSSS